MRLIKNKLERVVILTTLALALGTGGRALGQQLGGVMSTNTISQTVVLPKSVPDPLEPFNRVMWDLNKGLLDYVIDPTARVYRLIVRKPIREGLANMGTNLNYPDRLVNNALQGKWRGVKDETYRFLLNSTAGAAGFFDIASKKGIPRSEADFGQTFGQWGWKPDFYLMLPLLGPSNDRDAVGLAGDDFSNPLTYISLHSLTVQNPHVHTQPYSYFTFGITYNDLSDNVNALVRFSQSEMDPYSEIQYEWTFAREDRVANYRIKGKQDEASLETLESVFFTYKDPDFPNKSKTRSVVIPSTGRRLPFTYWLQPGEAPVVYIIPGLGAHRLAEASMALAELVYNHGFTAVCVSSPFNAEFMDRASTAALPAYLPVDGHDMLLALTAVNNRLGTLYPGRMTGKALMGYSMGAFDSLYIAATEASSPTPYVQFDHYVAVNAPVRLLYGASMLDQYYRAPLQWSDAERTENIENAFLKVAALSKNKLVPSSTLPFDAIESKFLVGLTFRFTLGDVIYASQRRNNQGVLRHPILSYRREPVYNEIMQYSYQDYFDKFVTPYYAARVEKVSAAELDKAGDLRTYEKGLRGNKKVSLIVNQNDFLLGDGDLEWFKTTFPRSQLTIFPEGGHLGNLINPNVQNTIIAALSGL